jgi:tRNA-modifying protein YgfZ
MEPPLSDTPWLDAACDTVTVTGADAMTYLQSQVSQELRDLPVGESRWTFLLEPTGRVVVLARVARTADDAFALHTDPGFGPMLLARLDRFKIRVAAETSLVEADAVTPADLEAARIGRGWPKMGAEIVPGETIPAETGLAGAAVNFTKGCYPGQELVERMDSRGAAAPRSLRRLRVVEGASPGDPVLDDAGASVGVLTSVHGTAALGYVKRGHDIGEVVQYG